ncbi:MAG: aquaporin [bacterium]
MSIQKYIAEFIGTFFLVLITGLTGSPIAIGLVFGVLIYWGSNISGGHFNPAISLAVVIKGGIKISDFIYYSVAQILGALFASLVIFSFRDVAYYPAPGLDVHFVKSMLCELMLTFLLCSVYLTVMFNKKFTGNYIYGIAVGFTLITITFTANSISGGVFNPALGLGTEVFDLFISGEGIKYSWLYIVGPFTGAALAGFVYNFFENSNN